MMREYLDNSYPYTVDDVVDYTEKLIRDAINEVLESED